VLRRIDYSGEQVYTHEEESQVEVRERCPCEDELDGVVDEFDLISFREIFYLLYCIQGCLLEGKFCGRIPGLKSKS
jgi:hypothetical protein